MRLIQKASQYFPFYLIITIWVIKIIQFIFSLKLSFLGTYPRHINDWYTALTGALIHSDFNHLINNTYPLIVCGFFIIVTFRKFSNIIFIVSYILSGLFIFLFARSNTYHIGASGVVFCWAAMLVTLGFIRGNIRSLGIGLIIIFLYGSMIWGILPWQPSISWDGHLLGGIAGILTAFIFQSINNQKEKPLPDSFDYNQNKNTGYEYIKRRQNQEMK